VRRFYEGMTGSRRKQNAAAGGSRRHSATSHARGKSTHSPRGDDARRTTSQASPWHHHGPGAAFPARGRSGGSSLTAVRPRGTAPT